MAQVKNLRMGMDPRKEKDDVHLTITGSLHLSADEVTKLQTDPNTQGVAFGWFESATETGPVTMTF